MTATQIFITVYARSHLWQQTSTWLFVKISTRIGLHGQTDFSLTRLLCNDMKIYNALMLTCWNHTKVIDSSYIQMHKTAVMKMHVKCVELLQL
jgi:hypothetical protein